jgi:hypothetical protein
MRRSHRPSPDRLPVVLTGAALLAGACLLALILVPSAGAGVPRFCSTPEEALRRYVSAVNAGSFDAQYALLALVEHEGANSAPISLLPRNSLRHLLTSLHPPFPSGLRLGARPLQAIQGAAPGQPVQEFGFLVPLLHSGRPVQPAGRYSGSYLVAVQTSPNGWKVRAWATYWMYFHRACGLQAGLRFRAAYQKEAERLGLSQHPRTAPIAAAR